MQQVGLLLSPVLICFDVPAPPADEVGRVVPVFRLLSEGEGDPDPTVNATVTSQIPSVGEPWGPTVPAVG